MKNKLFKKILLILCCGTSLMATAQTDTVEVQWQQFMAQLDTIPIESRKHLPIAQKLMLFAEKHYSKEDSHYNISLYHYATGLTINGPIATADSLFPQGWAWMQRRQPADTLAYAQWHTLKGNLFQLKGQDSAAIQINDAAIQYLQKTQNPVLKRYLNDFYTSNAYMYEATDLSKTFLYAQKSLIAFEVTPHLYPNNTYAILAIASYHRNMGNYTQAIAIVEKHLPRFSQNKEAYYDLLGTLAHIYTDMRVHDKSIALWKEIVDYTKKDRNNFTYAGALDNYAFASGRGEYHTQAFAATSEALSLLEASQDTGFYKLCMSHHIMYGAALQKWDTIQPMIQALELLLEQQKNEKPSQYREFIRDNLSTTYARKGDLQNAIRHGEKNVEILRLLYAEGEAHWVTGLQNLIELYIQNKQFKLAIPLIRDILSANNNKMVYQFESLDENAKELYLKNHLQRTLTLSLLALQKYGQQDTTAQKLLYDALLATKGVVLKGTKRMQQLAATHPDTSVQRLYQARLEIKTQLGKLYLATDSLKKIEKGLLESHLEQVERQLIVKLPLLESSFQNITYQNVQKALKSKVASVEFIHYRHPNPQTTSDSSVYAALILKPNQVYPELVFLFEERDLKKILHAAPKTTDLYPNRGENSTKRATNTENAPAHALYNLIWKPLLPHLDSIQTLYYAPSGLLNALSLDALMVNDSSFLSDRYLLHRCLSTGELVFEQEQPLAIESALLYGGIHYDAEGAFITTSPQTRSHPETQQDPQIIHFQQLMNHRGNTNLAWTYLDGTQKEVEILNGLLTKQHISVQVQNQKAASEAHFKSLGQQIKPPTILHLATHGFSFPAPSKDSIAKMGFKDAENPLIRSGLILAGANTAWLGKPIPEYQEDGILTAYEISNMQLNDIQLVVLSACETGLGDVRGTEGVYGLERAFKMAGVSYLVVSLWPLSDKPTVAFMEFFYQHLLAKKTVRQAFALAQTQMKARYSPYDWAGLVLVR